MCPSSASAAGPCVSVRTAFTITVIGWFSANPWSHDGIEATGTYALETNVSGKTMKASPCAACAVPASMPSEMNTHSNANPYTRHSRKARIACDAVPCSRNPTRNPMPVVITRLQTRIAVSAIARPESTALRGIGSERSRSTKPPSMSSAIAVAAPIPPKSTLVVTKPGTRKST